VCKCNRIVLVVWLYFENLNNSKDAHSLSVISVNGTSSISSSVLIVA
jgi:hypothetical protein